MGSAQVDDARLLVGHAEHGGQVGNAIGANAHHVGVIEALVAEVPSVVEGRLVGGEDPQGGGVAGLVHPAADGGEVGVGVDVVLGHEANIRSCVG